MGTERGRSFLGILSCGLPLAALGGRPKGALTGNSADVGIDDTFIASVREKVTPGPSALFLMTSDAVRDKVAAAFEGVDREFIHTNLSSEQEAALRAAFADQD